MKKQLIILDLDLSAVKPTIDYYMEHNPDSEYEFIVHQSEGLWSSIGKKEMTHAYQQARQLINEYKPHIIISNGFNGVSSQVKIFKECSNASYVGNSSIKRYNLDMLDAGADAIFAKDYLVELARNQQINHLRNDKNIRGMDPDFILWMIDNYDKLVAFEKPEKVVKMRANCLSSYYDKQAQDSEKVQKVLVETQAAPETIDITIKDPTTKPWWKFW